MTHDSRGHAVESADISDQRHENTMLNARNNETNQPSPEQLIENYPEAKLRSLMAKISSPRWVVPVLPDQELECLLNYAIELTKAGVDEECEPCMRFYRDGLTVSFVKILTDEAVNSWKYNIHCCILNSCIKFMQLCALHLNRDNSYLLDLLSVVLDPDNKFNTFNISRQPSSMTFVAIPSTVKIENSIGQTSTGSTTSTTIITPPPATTPPTTTSNTVTSAVIATTTTTSTPPSVVTPPQITTDDSSTAVSSTTSLNKSSASPVNTAIPSKQSPVQQKNDVANNTAGTSGQRSQMNNSVNEEQIFAKSPPEPLHQRGWLVDLINKFGHFGGFDHLLDRFYAGVAAVQEKCDENDASDTTDASRISNPTKSNGITNATRSINNKNNETNSNAILHLIYALVRPFGQCFELLTVRTIEKYFLPMWPIVLQLLNNLSDDELKREAKPEGRNDLINGIIKSARCLTSRLSNQESLIKELEMFRLKMILRLLKISSFNGKMSALNEINKILFAFSYYPRQSQMSMCTQGDDEIDWLSADKIVKWIKESNVLGIVLHDSLHQPQYVDKLEKILRFLIKEKALTQGDLDAVWQAQAGKHEAIVKNVHDLLAKLAYDFNTEQLDHLFGCFQASMKSANKHQRERLLELIRRLAEDDKSGVMAHKVLKLFWTLAHSLDMSKEVMEQALTAHVKILDYSCAQERDAQKTIWLAKCVEELKQDNGWVLPALRLIREICCLYDPSTSHVQRMLPNLNRQNVIERLQNEHTLVILVTNSLTSYMDRVRAIVTDVPDTVAETLILDGRYPHQQQIQERLDFLKFVLKDGQLWLCSDQAKQIWQCLAVNAAFQTDREECFRWFGKLMGEEPDLDPGINKDFFENNILQLDPQLLTESGIRCFERFFKAVNTKEEKLKAKSRSYILDDEDLIGKDYLWRVITTGKEMISHKAIQLLKEVSTALGPRLQANIAMFHENFIMECCDRLRAYHDTIQVLTETIQSDQIKDITDDDSKDIKMRHAEAEKMCRVIFMLLEYIVECDRAYTGERLYLPLSRAFRGMHITLYVRIQFPARQQTEDIEISTHSNEMVASFKRQLLKRIKGQGSNSIKIDFYYQNDNLIEIKDDQNAIGSYNIRDKMIITAKVTPYGPGLSSSPDSSSDSSTGSPPRPCPDMIKPENERQLPGIIISQKKQYIEFFLKIYQLGIDLNHQLLREGCRQLLHLLPIDRLTSQKLQQMCNPLATFDNLVVVTPESMFLHPPFAQVIYNLEVLYALLIPAVEHNQSFQMSWIHSGVAHFILDLLTKNNFIPNADVHTKRAAFTNVLRLSKIFLFVVGCVLGKVGNDPAPNVAEPGRSQTDLLKSTFINILGQSEQTIRAMASKLADGLSHEMLSYEPEGEACRKLFATALKWSCPDLQTIKAIVQLAWASGCGQLDLLGATNNFSESKANPDQHDHNLCKEALEVLTISFVLNPEASESLSRDPVWREFILALVLENPMRQIRQTTIEQIYFICTFCASDWRPFSFVITLLIDALEKLAPHYSQTCAEFFQLLCRTLNYGCLYSWPFPINDVLLTQEISWIRAVLESVKRTGETNVHEDLLEGHLCLTKELMFYFNADLKSQLTDFIMEILDEFLFPASRQYLQLHQNDHMIDFNAAPPVCRSPHTITAACDLLIALCQNSIPNMKLIVNNLVNMICTLSDPLREWEYLPPINARPFKGFCGLKNAGATCYMNSVLQQLFMVPLIRSGILSATGACNNPQEDFSNEADSSSDYYRNESDFGYSNMNTRDRYNVSILKHVQAIFAHLGHSALQFYVPRGLWSNFKLQGEPVNLREQQDAVEFFMSILDSLDEGLKALGHPQLMAGTLGGCFSDQKICKECPHRYSKEEPFSVFSVDIRNHSSLTESLEQYVKGELLEGADAYHCDKCNKKVVTIKRLCVRKLPPVLAIQLKRFEYDYERDCAIKFNDYFEFPRDLDMEPYTVSGLAKMEGEVIGFDDELDESQTTTKYQLTGIVVHSGQASGGHYFSYILHKDYENGKDQWYKFDDGEVTECKMHEDDELKAQCFGGDYMGEVFDSNLKRMQFRKQKRWWNAYMLFYTRCDQKFNHKESVKEQLSLAESRHCILPMPEPIERSVRIQNIRFLHSRSIFTNEFFGFIRRLVHASAPTRIDKLSPQMEELSLLGVQLASRFLFHTGFHTKKTLRGASTEWYDTLSLHLRNSTMVRQWFAEHALLGSPGRLAEYILIAPTPELRTMFCKLVVFLCHFAMNDEPLKNIETPADSLCEQIFVHVLYLLKSEVPENGKHLAQYFSLFMMYASVNVQQKLQLIKLNVPAIFMRAASDESPGQPSKHQYPELCKLHQLVSQLVRCSDITSECSTPTETPILLNIYGEPNLNVEDRPKLSKDAMQYLFQQTSYIKKVIEDVHVGDDGLKLLQYCCWENPIFSRNVLVELLWECGFAYWHDVRHHTDMLLNILLIEDSWQNHRIHNALLGVADDREGLLEIIQRTKTHYQKRAYYIMKCVVQLFKSCPCAHEMLLNNSKVMTQWAMACEWLREELEKRPSSQYGYGSWSHSTGGLSSLSTNDNSRFMIERSQSAKNLLTLAFELCPSELESTESDEISDGVLVRLQSQQMLDQLHADEPLEASNTGAVDGDKDSTESEDDPCESMQTQNDEDDPFETRLRKLVSEKKAKMDTPVVPQYDEDENDENDITDDEDEDDYSSTHTSEIQNHTGGFKSEQPNKDQTSSNDEKKERQVNSDGDTSGKNDTEQEISYCLKGITISAKTTKSADAAVKTSPAATVTATTTTTTATITTATVTATTTAATTAATTATTTTAATTSTSTTTKPITTETTESNYW